MRRAGGAAPPSALREALTLLLLALGVAAVGLAALHIGARIGCRFAECAGASVFDAVRPWAVWLPVAIWFGGKIVVARLSGPRLAAILAPLAPIVAVIATPAPNVLVDVVAMAIWLAAAWIAIHAAGRRAAHRNAPLLVGLLGATVLAGFGFWQLDRLDWKEAVLAEIDARLMGAPVALPAVPNEAADRFRAVRVTGRVAGDPLFVLTSAGGPGFRVIAPIEVDGRRVMVDLGFVADAARGALALPDGPLAITGNLHWPDDKTSATPGPDPSQNLRFDRDVAEMAAALGAEPLLVTARAVEPSTGLRPLPVASEAIANNHLGYAVQWFGLSIVWAGMTLYLAWRIRRRTI